MHSLVAAEERTRLHEAAAAERVNFKPMRLSIDSISFIQLKTMLIERGVPAERVAACANKFALMALAKDCATVVKIEWLAAEADV